MLRPAAAAVAAVALLAACSSAIDGRGVARAPSSAPRTARTTPTASTSTTPTTTRVACVWGPSAGTTKQRTVTTPATTTPLQTGTVTVSVTTNRGAMTFTLDRAAAPCTVASFESLVRQKYFDKTPCHRLTTAGIYVLQCGDPSGLGTGGPGYTVPDEATGTEQYPAATIAMSRTPAPNSGGSQFFIVWKDSPLLRQNLGRLEYTVFGRVTSGMGVVDAVAAGGTDDANGPGDGAPKLKLEINSMTKS